MDSRLGEVLSMGLKMRGVPKETKEIIKKIKELECEVNSYMDWNHWDYYSSSDELKALLKEMFVEEKEVK